MARKRGWIGGMLKAPVLLVLVVLMAAAVWCTAVLMKKDEERRIASAAEQPLTTPAASVAIHGQEELEAAAAAFPIPVLTVGWKDLSVELIDGLCEDVPFENGVARKMTVRYRMQSGGVLTAESIYPARAVTLIERAGYHAAETRQNWLAGLQGMFMTDGRNNRIHAVSHDGAYVCTWPAAEDAGEILKWLQLTQRTNE